MSLVRRVLRSRFPDAIPVCHITVLVEGLAISEFAMLPHNPEVYKVSSALLSIESGSV